MHDLLAWKLTEGAASAGDGLISAHETCISAHDFRIVAGFGKREVGVMGVASDGRGASDKAVDSSALAITPHDINSLTQVKRVRHAHDAQRVALTDLRIEFQFTLFKHHKSLVPVNAFSVTPTKTPSFDDYESFMEAMLVLYGDSTAEPDLMKVP